MLGPFGPQTLKQEHLTQDSCPTPQESQPAAGDKWNHSGGQLSVSQPGWHFNKGHKQTLQGTLQATLHKTPLQPSKLSIPRNKQRGLRSPKKGDSRLSLVLGDLVGRTGNMESNENRRSMLAKHKCHIRNETSENKSF